MLVLASMHAQKRLGTCGTCVQIISHSIISHARVCVCVCVCARARAQTRLGTCACWRIRRCADEGLGCSGSLLTL